MTAEQPLRIAYLTGQYPKASHTFIQREVSALRAHGAEIITTSVVRPKATELIGAEEKAAHDETFYIQTSAKRPIRLLRDHAAIFLRNPRLWSSTFFLALRTGRPGARGLLWQLFYFLEAGVLARHLLRHSTKHLHNHFADSSCSVAMLAAKLAEIPFSFTIHGPTEFFAAESWRLDTKIACAAFVVCISKFSRSQAMIFSDPVHWDKLNIVHCGLTPSRYHVGLASNRSGLHLLFVGRLIPLKGLRVLFAALERLKASHGNIVLDVIGDGPDWNWAHAEAARIGNINLLGYQSQDAVADALGKADALVLPSFAEGLPIVLMEALAASRPVIATRVAAVSELVEDGVSGLLVAPGDIEELSSAIARLADDSKARIKMGAAGREKVLAEFDSKKEAERLLALFRHGTGRVK